MNHLLRFYKDSVLAACETQKIAVCKPMTPTRFAAMIKAAKVTGKGVLHVACTYLYQGISTGYGACVGGPKSNAFNLIVRQYTHLKVMFWYFFTYDE